MACNFSSLIWPAGSAPAALFFDPPEPQIIGKTQCFGLSYLFAHLDLLSSHSSLFDLLSSSLLFSDSSHLCFSSVHIVGSLTSKTSTTAITPAAAATTTTTTTTTTTITITTKPKEQGMLFFLRAAAVERGFPPLPPPLNPPPMAPPHLIPMIPTTPLPSPPPQNMNNQHIHQESNNQVINPCVHITSTLAVLFDNSHLGNKIR